MVKDAAQKGDPKPVPAGLLRARADGAFAIEVSVPKEGALAAAAITLEKKGGAEKPTTTPLLSGAI